MADKKISQLTLASSCAGSDVLPIVQSATTKKLAIENLVPKNLKSKDTSGVVQITGPAAASTRVMTLPDADATLLYSGGALGTPSSGNLANCTFPTIPIASGGTNQTSFTGKSSDVAGLVFFDGTKLANDTTVTNVGYDTVSKTLRGDNLQTTNLFNGPHHWGALYNSSTGTTTRIYDTTIGHITDTLGWASTNTRNNQPFSGKAAIYELVHANDPNAVNVFYSQAQNGFVYIWADFDGSGVAWKIEYYKVYEAPHALGSTITVSAVFYNTVTATESNYVPIYGTSQSQYKLRLKAVHATDPGVSGVFYLKRIL